MKRVTFGGEVGEVILRKSKRTRRLSLRITAEGEVEATLPYYLPFSVAESFIKKQSQWITQHRPAASQPLGNDKLIGKDHILRFKTGSDRLYSRVGTREVIVNVPNNLSVDDASVQQEAKKASIRALKRQAEARLPTMLHRLAKDYGYNYRHVTVRAMKSRWGSCSSNRTINLSVWLMQLPNELIEYVLSHELAHLNHMNHGQMFWQELGAMTPNYKALRQQLKNFSPRLM